MKNKTALAALCLSATVANAADPVKVIPPQQKTLSSEHGRYVFGQISDARRDQYMLDTKSGRLWRVVNVPPRSSDGTPKIGVEGYPVLEPIPYTDSNGRESVEPKQ